MQHVKIVSAAACALALLVGTTAPGRSGDRNQAGPLLLSNSQLDRVTAGTVGLDLAGAATATGNFASTGVSGAGTANHTSLPGGGFVEGGVIAGHSVAIAPSGTMNTGLATSATSSLPIVSGGAGGTLTTPFSQTTISMSYAYGGTTFLP
jgi:hypothetical protein